MKLEKLHVHNLGAYFKGEGDAITGGDVRVSVEFEKLPSTAGSQNQVTTLKFFSRAGATVKTFYSPDFSLFHQNFRSLAIFKHLDFGGAYSFAEGDFNVFASGITPGMQNPGDAVRCLQSQGNFAVKGIKGHPKVDQFGNAGGSLIDQNAHCLFITQASTGADGIAEVKLGGIISADSGGNASLGIFGIAVVNAAFSDDQHASLLFCQQGSIKSSNTTTDDNIVVVTHCLVTR
ncbi:hypothetical protein ES703_86627 [subsurface metagenome]